MEMIQPAIAHFEDGGMAHKPGKTKEMDCLQELPGRNAAPPAS